MGRRSRDEWRLIVEKWRKSGQSRRKFALENGLPVENVTRWVRHFAEESPAEAASFVEVTNSTSAPRLELRLRDFRIFVDPGFASRDLSRVLDALEKRS